jgi:uncharacterized membrane protein required for colicin V production
VIADIVIGLIVLICVVVGTKRGFVRSVLLIVATALSLTAAFVLTKPAATFLEEKFGLAAGMEGWLGISGGVWLTVLTAVSIFILVRLVLIILDKCFRRIKENIKTINALDRLLGFFFGIAMAGVIAVGLFMIINALHDASILADLPIWCQLAGDSGSFVAAPFYAFSVEHIFPVVNSVIENIVVYTTSMVP